MARKRSVPKLETDEQAAEFWDSHSLADYVHGTEVVEGATFPSSPLKQISLRLAPAQIDRLKRIAASKGIRYQTLIRMWITERMREEDAAQPRRASR